MLPVLWLILVLIASVMSSPAGPETDLPLDKAAHFVIYGITAVILFRSLEKRTDIAKALYSALILSTGYGVLMEVIQSFIPYRSFSWGDMAANAAGAAVCGVLYAKIRSDMGRRMI